MFSRFTSQERTNLYLTAFFLYTPDFSLSKVTALKVVWGKDTSRRKSQEVTFPRVSRRGRHFANVGDVIIYPDPVVARTVEKRGKPGGNVQKHGKMWRIMKKHRKTWETRENIDCSFKYPLLEVQGTLHSAKGFCCLK